METLKREFEEKLHAKIDVELSVKGNRNRRI